MSKSKNKIIGITLGDPAGIGPEVTAAALSKTCFPRGVQAVVIGDEGSFARFWPKKRALPPFIHVAGDPMARHESGRPSLKSGRDSLLYLETAVELLKAGQIQALVTAPVAKEAIARFLPGFKGHTTFLAQAFGLKNVEMVFVADDVKLVLVTRHVALKELSRLITTDKVLSVLSTTNRFLVRSFGIRKPRIAVLGLNPHAGEAGEMGREELEAIIPAMKRAKARGLDVSGPFPADTFFEPRNCQGYDLVAAMYHDQGLIALKSRYFDRLVNLTIGLPFIRTSPAHGTAFGIAGKGIADAGSMKAAIELAIRLKAPQDL
jgi:4-hydroxythreonine-4-phosphate dehydrogenase